MIKLASKMVSQPVLPLTMLKRVKGFLGGGARVAKTA